MTAGVDGQIVRGPGRLAAYASFVKVAHTIFALPFTIVGIVLATRTTHPLSARQVALAVLAFGAARFAAMGFNRIADLKWDRLNPRTAGRELPRGKMSVREAWILVLLMSAIFLGAAAALNPLCLALSPFALLWVLGYSFTKRFTSFSHLWLGWGLAIAPVGGYLAVTGAWSTPWWLLLLLAGGVACWVTGFDTLYALQDESFDKAEGLKSLPVLLGARSAIMVARLSHICALLLLTSFWAFSPFGPFLGLSLLLSAFLLAWEHRLVKVGDYSKLDAAFFTMNGIVSAVILAGALADTVLHG